MTLFPNVSLRSRAIYVHIHGHLPKVTATGVENTAQALGWSSSSEVYIVADDAVDDWHVDALCPLGQAGAILLEALLKGHAKDLGFRSRSGGHQAGDREQSSCCGSK
jgi:hypothetical protein